MSFKAFNTTLGGVSGLLNGAVTGDWSGMINSVSSGIAQDYENYEAKAAAKRANQEQIAFWHMQNEYNSPVAQMERLKEAGLNPMLVYGGGNVAGNSASAIGTAQTYGNKTNYEASIQGIQAMANLKNTNQNTQAQEANTLATYQDIANMQTANKIQQANLQQQQQDVEMGALDLEYAKKAQAVRLRQLETQGKQADVENTYYDSDMGAIEYGAKKAVDFLGGIFGIGSKASSSINALSSAERNRAVSRALSSSQRHR